MERVPKNIRQIGGREERVKTYLEDYVSTYLRKLQEEREENGAVGVLAGRWETEEGPHCVFINGAAEMRGAETGGGRLRVTEDAWNSVYESLGTYFSGQDLCGIFVCEGSCRRFRRQALFQAVRESFPDSDEALLYLLTEEGEEILYRITRKNEERLQGYYCYFERNDAMQEYMMENLSRRQVEKEELPGRRGRKAGTGGRTGIHGEDRQPVSDREGGNRTEEPYPEPDRADEPWNSAGRVRASEGSLGDPVKTIRERMRRQKEIREEGMEQEADNSYGPDAKGETGTDPGRKSGGGFFGLCLLMAVAVFAGGVYFMREKDGGIRIKDILDSLQIDASGLLAVAANPTEEPSESESVHIPVIVEEVPGNVYPTQGDAPIASAGVPESETAPGHEGSTDTAVPGSKETEPSQAGGEAQVTEGETPGASQPETQAPQDTQAPPVTESPTQPPPETQTPPSDTQAPPPTEPLAQTAAAGVTYVVEAGDSLYSISRKFYGTESMVGRIQELNGLSNADLIKEGQTLLLP